MYFESLFKNETCLPIKTETGQLGSTLKAPRAGIVYSRLFKYTQLTTRFTENSIGPRTS